MFVSPARISFFERFSLFAGFEGSVGINNPCFFLGGGVFPCLFPQKKEKEEQGNLPF